MTPDDAPAPSRGARRVPTAEIPTVGIESDASDRVLTLEPGSVPPTLEPSSIAAPPTGIDDSATMNPLGPLDAPDDDGAATTTEDGRPLALAWVDERSVGLPRVPDDLSTAATAYVPVEPDLLAHLPRQSPLRAGVIVPTVIIAGLVSAYAATTLLWPLHAVAPIVTAVAVQPSAAPATAPPWPSAGSAAVSVGGIQGSAASAADAHSIASITKVVTALVVLDEMPLALGEQGPEYRFDYGDSLAYWQYRANGESALDVPVGGTLTQYQLLEGMLIGSANNYADRLAANLFPSDGVFADAATSWLSTHGVPGVTVVEPTGIDPRNTATPEALLTLAQKALANPVIAEIVAKKSVDLPGAGAVENTNGLLADPGVLGIKTGTLDAWNLLSAKEIVVGETPVRIYASVLGQPDDEARLAASRALYTQLEQELQLTPSVPAGTLAGTVDTAWGEHVDILTADDASVVLWNGASGTVATTYALEESREEGDTVGSLTVDGPLDAAAVDLRLADDVAAPSAWWRLTHPLELFGLTD
ncbi:D-alanyl-D-alanine carboxypeptidase family protein [Microbacterium sulfonylureivorans]|uniref:D-alanyl-D-alanine carboxypeptidase family protein n=1 Tax=Microbacterium sulfonylureivorans TaxID=2486854 RepID=UPI000FDA3503|nr:D-alanyl-D-alanine carboxypeptidase [Microbacterium sulfonylureivorans]